MFAFEMILDLCLVLDEFAGVGPPSKSMKRKLGSADAGPSRKMGKYVTLLTITLFISNSYLKFMAHLNSKE